MKRITLYICLIIGSFWVSACTLLNPPTTSTNSSHKEDLSVYRVNYDIQTPVDTVVVKEGKADPSELNSVEDVGPQLDNLLEEIASVKGKKGFVEGYSVQVYSGDSRELAMKAKDRVYRILPDARPKLDYRVPYFTVKVGRYRNRLEAHETFAKLKNSFPTAIVVPQRIYSRN